jgi:hypothetical protein
MMRRALLLISLMAICFLAAPLSVAAFDPFPSSSVNCSSATSSAVCTDKTTTTDPVTTTIINVTHIIALVAGIAAVILIIIGGLRYITANGDSNNINSAKNTILNALIGLVVIVAAQAIIAFVVDRL